MKRLFTLIELIIVIVVIGILAVIVIPNISSVKDEATGVVIANDTKNIQTAIDIQQVNNQELPIVGDSNIALGNPQKVDFDKISPEYLREKPKQGNFWIDYNKIVYGSTIDVTSERGIEFTINNNEITWNKVDGAIKYQLYGVDSELKANVENQKLIPLGKPTTDNKYQGSEIKEGNDYFITISDIYGNWTPALGENYITENYIELETKLIDLNEDVGSEQIKTFTINNLKKIEEISSDNGNVEIISIEGDKVTVKLTDGNLVRKEQTGGEFIEEDSKFVTEQTSPDYSKDGYEGTLKSYKELEKKMVTNHEHVVEGLNHGFRKITLSSLTFYTNKYSGELENWSISGHGSQYINSYDEDRVWTLSDKINTEEILKNYQPTMDIVNLIEDNQYKGCVEGSNTKYVYYQCNFKDIYGNGYNYIVDADLDTYYGGIIHNLYFEGTILYTGYIERETGNTLYEGEVVRPEKDTRTYNEYYHYNLTVKYTTK